MGSGVVFGLEGFFVGGVRGQRVQFKQFARYVARYLLGQAHFMVVPLI